MPRTRSLAWSELKTGLLAVIAIAIAATLIFMLGGEGGFFWQRYPLKVKFPNVAGLKAGAPVRVSGVEVGSVTDIQFSGTDVDVIFELRKEMQSRVTTDSVATIGSVSLLGESALDISGATTGKPLPEGAYVKSGRTPGQLADVAEQANRSLQQATELIKDIRAGKGTVGKLFTDEELYREVNQFVAAAADVADHLRKGRGTIGKLAIDDAVYRGLESSLRNLQSITERINAGEGSLGRLLKDDAFAASLSSATKNVDSLTAGLTRGEGTAGRLLKDEALYKRLDSISTRIDDLTKKLNEGEGTAAQLLNDRKLYDNITAATSELRGLIGDIRRDPQKYLRLKVSIF
jgi:phospholipid/cholesterol/gamma-HCH transport system substrate-binding protein